MKKSEKINYYDCEGTPVIKSVGKDGKETIRAYSANGLFDYPHSAWFTRCSRVCKESYDDLVKNRDYEAQLGRLKSKDEKTPKDERKIGEIMEFKQEMLNKQLSGYYTLIDLTDELAELGETKQRTPQMDARMEEIKKFLMNSKYK